MKQQNIVLRILRTASVSLLLLTVLSTTGCLGMVLRAATTGPRYAIARESMAPIPSGKGRAFVYLSDGGPSPMNTLGFSNYCTVDRYIYNVVGATYIYVDLPPGDHKVTADGVIKAFKSQYGKNVAKFELQVGEVKYCRIDLEGFGGFTSLTPLMVDAMVAEKEMAQLPFNKDHLGTKTVRE